jgi:hypothetical protein
MISPPLCTKVPLEEDAPTFLRLGYINFVVVTKQPEILKPVAGHRIFRNQATGLLVS